MRDALRRDLRLAGIAAACGLVTGAVIATLIIWRYTDRLGPRDPAAVAPVASDSRWQDGLGPADTIEAEDTARPRATTGSAPSVTLPEAVRELRDRDLELPVEGVKQEHLTRSFADARSGNRVHEALDILAPRNTPVKAVEDGRVVKLFTSKAGGLTIYQFDPSERFCYYYAHLDGYAPGLQEGATVRKGQVIGYVGITGNAPKNTPHLHFAVFQLNSEKRWWEGTPIDPFDVLR